MHKKFLFILIFISIIAPLFPSITYSSSSYTMLIATTEKGIQISYNEGNSWKSLNNGLPDSFTPISIFKYNETMYLTTFSSGIFRYNAKNEFWENISSPEFKRKSIYYSNIGYRKISAFSVDPNDNNNLVLATKHSLYRSTDGGSLWKNIPINGLNKRNYITSLAISGNKIYQGTSFNGIFESTGNDFKPLLSGLPVEPYSDTLNIPEQSAVLYIDKTGLYSGFYFGSGLYFKDHKSKSFTSIYTVTKKNLMDNVYDIKVHDNKLYFSYGKEILCYDNKSILPVDSYNNILKKLASREDIISSIIYDNTGKLPAIAVKHPNPERKKRSLSPSNKNAIYINIPSLKNIDKYISYTKKSKINAFIIDMKDDFGNIYFTAQDKIASEINAQKKPVEISKILGKLKDNNIYSIARVVVFKDQKLWSAYNGKYAIRNKNTNLPWKGAEGEFWVDPFSSFVHEYNINLAKDLEKLGFNEIQFDYIRFPSDGPIHLCSYLYKNQNDSYKSEILIDFLTRAKYSLGIPVSVDIYGFNSWYYFGNWIGQDIEELSHVVDVISPMVYPSHFGSRFYNRYDKRIKPFNIIRDGGIRGIELSDRSVYIRPYLQAFNLLSPTWGPDYIFSQINASKESGCSGYSLWNAKGDYTVPYSALKKD